MLIQIVQKQILFILQQIKKLSKYFVFNFPFPEIKVQGCQVRFARGITCILNPISSSESFSFLSLRFSNLKIFIYIVSFTFHAEKIFRLPF
jgi:hypothetical protein